MCRIQTALPLSYSGTSTTTRVPELRAEPIPRHLRGVFMIHHAWWCRSSIPRFFSGSHRSMSTSPGFHLCYSSPFRGRTPSRKRYRGSVTQQCRTGPGPQKVQGSVAQQCRTGPGNSPHGGVGRESNQKRSRLGPSRTRGRRPLLRPKHALR